MLKRLLEVVPIRIFPIKFLSVAAEEEQCEEGKEDAPKCSPHRQVVNNRRAAHLVLQLDRRQLHIEGDGIRVIGQVVHH